MEEAQTTLRESLAQSLDSIETEPVEPVAEVTEAEPVETSEQTEERLGRTAGRQRDEKGRLLPGKAERPEPVETAPVETPKHKKPSTWKKELDGDWEAINPTVQAEILRREGDYAKGVSTYKTEFERLKPLDDAMAEFRPLLKHHGVNETQWIANLGRAHQHLALGTAEQKLTTFAKLAQEYGVDLAQMFVRGEDGQIYYNQQIMQQPAQPQVDVNTLVSQRIQEALAQHSTQQEVRNFSAAKDDKGNPKYPHLATVKQTMAGILQAGLADDLDGAYQAALRMPQHADLFEAQQQQQRQTESDQQQRAKVEAAARARRNAVSPKSATPTGEEGKKGGKGLRDILEEQFSERDSGRV